MSISTVNVSIQDDFLVQLDQIANSESITRSEIIKEALNLYFDKKNIKNEFEQIFKIGKQIGSTLDISAEDVMGEIKEYCS